MQTNETKVLTDTEHVLQRPQMYLGSTDINNEKRYVVDKNGKILHMDIEFVPALIKVVSEIINNSVDEYIRTNGAYSDVIKIAINDDGVVNIDDNGRGIPSKIEKKTGLPSPVVCVTELKAGGNFENDTISKTQGAFGVGAACTNIMSKKFLLKTNDGKIETIVSCKNNMNPNDIEWKQNKKTVKHPYTNITFTPDFERFSRDNFTIYEIACLKKYLLDLSMCYPGITFYFNDDIISCASFKDYVGCYSENAEIFEYNHCKIAVFSGDENSRISFVNGLNVSDGGTHVNHVIGCVVNEIRAKYKKKYEMSPTDIYSNLHFIIILSNIISPKFSSQTKEKLTTAVSKMKYAFEDIDWKKIALQLTKNKSIIEPILKIYKVKENLRKKREIAQKEKELTKTAIIPKLIEPSNNNPAINRLYLAEGDSALNKFSTTKSSFMGGFPLRGKFISCWNRSVHSILENSEVFTLCKVLGLSLSNPNISKSKYSEICIMTDSDEDGNHICALLCSFIYKFWPDFFKKGKVFRAVSPLIILEDNTTFYSLTAFKEYQQKNDNIAPMKIYNKGLGSLSHEDYEKMLNTLQPISLDDDSYESLKLAFDKDLANKRKKWLM